MKLIYTYIFLTLRVGYEMEPGLCELALVAKGSQEFGFTQPTALIVFGLCRVA